MMFGIRRSLLILLLAVISFAANGALAENVSSAFDGHYAGQRELNSALSASDCGSGESLSIVISGGAFWESGGEIKGIVTSDGFFTGSYMFGGDHRPFEGLVNQENMVGGVVSADGRCFWMVRLAKRTPA